MSNGALISISVVFVVLLVVVFFYLKKQSENEAQLIKQQQLSQLINQKAGISGFFNNILNSNAVTAFGGGFGKGLGTIV